MNSFTAKLLAFMVVTLFFLWFVIPTADAGDLYWCPSSGSFVSNPADCLSCSPH